MSTAAIGEILGGCRVKVRCNSYYEGQMEGQLWRPIGNGTKRGARRRISAIMKAAQRFELRTRIARKKQQPGARNGQLGKIGLDVLEKLYDIVDFATGRLEPSVAYLAEELGYSYGAVHAALKRLWTAGFLKWWRRSRKTDNRNEAGPQVEQITNAYVLMLPPALDAYVKRLLGAPIAHDIQWDKEEEKRQFEAMLSSLTAVEYVDATFEGDLQLGHHLKSLASLLDAQERESTRASETGGL